jgi:hypothetical protein
VKLGNAYVVAPPSLHSRGNRYEFEASSAPRDVDIAPLPDGLLSVLKRNGNDVSANIEFSAVLPDVTDLQAALGELSPPGDAELHRLITDDPKKSQERLGKPSRSEVDQSVIIRLRSRGASPELIKAIFLQYAIGKKYKENGRHGDEYLATCIQNADAHLSRDQEDGGSDTDDDGKQKEGPRRKRLLTQDYIDLYGEWGYTVKLNLCNDDIEVNGEILNDVTESQIRAKVRDYGTVNQVGVSVQHAIEALVDLSVQNAYHPIRQYLESLEWDGRQHIEAFTDHFRDKEGVFGKWMKHWFVGCVAKVYEGFQNPMIVFDGKQDIGKSYAANWLCSPLPSFFLASAIYPENKDHRLRLIQTWIWEVEELGVTTRKADVEALKAFITQKTVRERKAYGRRDIIKPATASFIGTINNDSGFLVDRTGNRRFLVCTLERIDWSYAQTVNVDQLWANAVQIYRNGGDSWKLSDVDKAQRDQINDEYLVDDPIEAYICQDYTFTGDLRDMVILPNILGTLEGHGIKPSRSVTMQIASVMRSQGAEKRRERIDGTRQRVYYGVREKKAGDSNHNTA